MYSTAIQKLEVDLEMTAEERLRYIAALGQTRVVEKGQDLISQGETATRCAVLLEGFAARRKTLLNGQTQILSFVIPGDMCDLHSLFLKPIDHSISALTNCRVAYMPHAVVRQLIADFPRMGLAFWRETLIDGAIFREWVANIGSRNAYTRVAHLLSEIHIRLDTVGLVTDLLFEFPITQQTLAEATGLSVVHMNRTLQRLKREGVVDVSERAVRVLDWKQLQSIGEFEQSYLYTKAA